MRRALLVLVMVLVPVAAVVAAAPSCQDFPPVVPCDDIADGGCPIDRGGTCDDPTCNAIYDCVNGEWTIAQACMQPDAGAGGSGSDDGGPVDSGAADGCTPVKIDTTGQTTGCMPDNAFPDCPAAAAEGCAESVCLTGCSDFFLCVAVGTGMCLDTTGPCWIDVAYCTDDGELVVTQ